MKSYICRKATFEKLNGRWVAVKKEAHSRVNHEDAKEIHSEYFDEMMRTEDAVLCFGNYSCPEIDGLDLELAIVYEIPSKNQYVAFGIQEVEA